MEIDGKEYTNGSVIEFANYDHYPNGRSIDPNKSYLIKLQKGILKFDYRTKVSKSFFSWNKVGVGEPVWFIKNITDKNVEDYLLSETNILNNNNVIDHTKHNILVENEEVREQKKQQQEREKQKQIDEEKRIAVNARIQSEIDASKEFYNYRNFGGTRRKRKNKKNRKTRYGMEKRT